MRIEITLLDKPEFDTVVWKEILRSGRVGRNFNLVFVFSVLVLGYIQRKARML
jgi:hypothetical protein